MSSHPDSIIVRELGLQAYEPVWRQMQHFTAQRNADTTDELWLLQHPPVFTLGLNGKQEHVLAPGTIPVIPIDRGGQVTYHGPGQIVLYTLLDLKRLGIGVRQLVTELEQAVIALLADYAINAQNRADAPGVYVNEAKIAALGLRVKRGATYHGLALNVRMDLEPFARINPCGYADMPVTQLADLGVATNATQLGHALVSHLTDKLGYNSVSYLDGTNTAL